MPNPEEELSVKVDPDRSYNLSGIKLIAPEAKMVVSKDNKFTMTGTQIMLVAERQAKLIADLMVSQEELFIRIKAISEGASDGAAILKELQDNVR